MERLFIQRYQPQYAKVDDIWIKPSSTSETGEIKQFTANGGWKNLVTNNLFNAAKSLGYSGDEKDFLESLAQDAESPDSAAGIKTSWEDISIQDTLDSLPISNNLNTITQSVQDVTIEYTKNTLVDGVYSSAANQTIGIPAATTSLAGVMTATDKSKLNGIATAATANPIQTAITPLDAAATLEQVVAAYNNLLVKLQAAKILS